jgi:hypothetical protein
MAHFAQLDENNVVIQVIVVGNNDITDPNTGQEDENIGISFCQNLFGGTWKQTSYNGNIRFRYAGEGYTYNEELDAFIPPQPFPSWILENDIADWIAPIPQPELTEEQSNSETHLYFYVWNEDEQTWDLNVFEYPQQLDE